MDEVIKKYPNISKCFTKRSKTTEFAIRYFEDKNVICEQPDLAIKKLAKLRRLVEVADFLNLLSNNEFFKAKNVSFELFENQDFYHIQPYIHIPSVNYENKVVDKKIELRGYKCDKKIYNPNYFKDDFFKEENIKYRFTDISINEINNFFLESLSDEYILKKDEIKNILFIK